MTKQTLSPVARGWHRHIAMVGGLGLLLWGVSGLLHPLMTTFGPQQSTYAPPAGAIDLTATQPLSRILRQAGIHQAAAVRVVITEQGQRLQVTPVDASQARRYFNLVTGEEIPDYDSKHAEFLARHYLNLGDRVAVRGIQRLTEFTPDYPWVNRLLPVYRVDFANAEDLSAYIYTETNALAGVTNNFKRVIQSLFRWLHTWSWLPVDALRVPLVSVLVGSALALMITGSLMLLRRRSAVATNPQRRWHRRLAYGLALPVFMFTVSGLFHLYQYAINEGESNLRFGQLTELERLPEGLVGQWSSATEGLSITNVSVVATVDGHHLYRLGLALNGTAPTSALAIRNARFDGVETTGPALYVDAESGAPWLPGDRELALQLAEQFSGSPRAEFTAVNLVQRFGPGYDFRNKRLPVWQVDTDDGSWFVDTTTGVLADRVAESSKPERLSFSLLHKWNFLFPLGRTVQNLVVSVVVLTCLIGLAGFGLALRFNRRRRTRVVPNALGNEPLNDAAS